jgi:hypothetical protein
LIIYPEDRVLIAIMNNLQDWEIVQNERWYRIPVKKTPEDASNIDWLAFYFTAKFDSDKWAIHYFSRVEGHELVTRADLFPNQADHPRAGNWYFKLALGPLHHKIPPIVSNKWRRITFILTTGDRFENAIEINDLFDRESPLGRLYVTLKEEGYSVEQFWYIQEGRTTYEVDLAIGTPRGWLPVNLTPRPQVPTNVLKLSADSSFEECLAQIKSTLDLEK